ERLDPYGLALGLLGGNFPPVDHFHAKILTGFDGGDDGPCEVSCAKHVNALAELLQVDDPLEQAPPQEVCRDKENEADDVSAALRHSYLRKPVQHGGEQEAVETKDKQNTEIN